MMMSGDSPIPFLQEKRHQRVSQEIRNSIFNGSIRPGDRPPPQRDMSKAFGVSRITIREALKSLTGRMIISGKTKIQRSD